MKRFSVTATLFMLVSAFLCTGANAIGPNLDKNEYCIRVFCNKDQSDKIKNRQGRGKFFPASRVETMVRKNNRAVADITWYIQDVYLSALKAQCVGVAGYSNKLYGSDANKLQFFAPVDSVLGDKQVRGWGEKCSLMEKKEK